MYVVYTYTPLPIYVYLCNCGLYIIIIILCYYIVRDDRKKNYIIMSDERVRREGAGNVSVCVCLRVQQETERPRRRTGGGGLSRSSLTGATLYLFFFIPTSRLSSLRPTTSEIYIFFDYSLGDGGTTMISICGRTPR